MQVARRPFEIFSGTGGVGKTTLATARAISLAQSGLKVLLITIDPAKRLRDLLNIKLEQAGEIIPISDPLQNGDELQLDVELLDPSSTFKRISKDKEIYQNRILSVLMKPYGGLNEIMAVVELGHQYETKKYDIIVLDTPPGSHFLDFLDSSERIRVFFD